MNKHQLRLFLAFALVAFLVLCTGTSVAAAAGERSLEEADQEAQVSPDTFQIARVDEKWAMQDGIKLPVSVFWPVAEDESQAFPMIVFVHPLGVDILTYENQAMDYAAKGYVAVVYGVRGSFGAEGQFNMIDPAVDLPDLSRIITVASQDQRFPVLHDEIGPVVGVTGYSQGGVISYLIASRKNPRPGDPGDPRVRTTVTLHGGADLLYSMLPNGAPNMVVGGVIVGGCYMQNMASFLLNIVNAITRQDMGAWDKLSTLLRAVGTFLAQPVNNVDPRVAWACGVYLTRDVTQYSAVKHYIEQRSVRYWCDENYDGVVEHAITTPMLIVTGWNDDAFFPNEGLRILSTCMDAPGRMIITNHGHCAGFGDNIYVDLPGNPAGKYVDQQTQAWFDHFLKGVDNGIEEEAKVSFYRDGQDDPEHYGTASSYPLPGTTQDYYYLGGGGKLSTTPPNGSGFQSDLLINIGFTASIYMGYWMDVPELVGLPDLAIPKKIKFFEIPLTERGYVSDVLTEDLTIMGAPQVVVYYRNSGAFTQLDPTLYEVTPDGREILVSRGAYEGYNAASWSENNTAANPIEMQCCYHRFQAGSRIKLDISTASLIDILPIWGFNLILLHHKQDMASSLSLPVVPNTY